MNVRLAPEYSQALPHLENDRETADNDAAPPAGVHRRCEAAGVLVRAKKMTESRTPPITTWGVTGRAAPGVVESRLVAANELVLGLARKLRERLDAMLPGRVLEARIFGSQARGDAREDSDLDVFVLVDEVDAETQDAIYAAASDVWSSVDGAPVIVPLIRSRAQFDEMIRRERRLGADILAEGIPV